MIKIGVVQQIVRYPVKSMAGTSVATAELGWHGLAGDRRFAFRRVKDHSDFPWLTASRFPQLLLYSPFRPDNDAGEAPPSHVRTPTGQELELQGEALREEISRLAGHHVEVMNVRNGVFDDGVVSVITSQTIDHICRGAGVPADPRRFRANIVVAAAAPAEFTEETWVGGTLHIGGGAGARIAVTAGDVRCMMINLDPDTAVQDPAVMKYVVRRNDNIAGVYGTCVRAGALQVGQDVYFEASAS